MPELIRIDKDEKTRRAVLRPLVIEIGDEITVIPKDAILCDFCNAEVDVMDKGEETKVGYALLCEEGCCISHVICQNCRIRDKPISKYEVTATFGGENHE